MVGLQFVVLSAVRARAAGGIALVINLWDFSANISAASGDGASSCA